MKDRARATLAAVGAVAVLAAGIGISQASGGADGPGHDLYDDNGGESGSEDD